MKYYDYFDIDDEINIAVRAYNDNKNTIGQYKNEISEIQKENAKLDKQINGEKDAILKRKYERQAEENLNALKEKESKAKEIEEEVKGKINIAKTKLENKINEKNSKIETSERNVEVINKQLDIVKKEIEATENRPDTEISLSIKESILEGLHKKQEEYEKMINEHISNSEKLTEEKIELSKLYDSLAFTNMNRFISEWNKVSEKSVSTPTTPVSTPTTPVSTPTTPVSTPTTPVSTPTTPVSTPTTPVSTPTTPVSTPTTPVSTPTTPVSTPTTPVSTPTTPDKERKIKLKIGRNLKLEYTDTEHKELEFNQEVSNKVLRKYVNKMSNKRKLRFIEDLYNEKINSDRWDNFQIDDSMKKKIKDNLELFDDSIVSGLYCMRAENTQNELLEEKQKKERNTMIKAAIVGYVESTLKNKKVKAMDITYDKSDLAKINIPIISKFLRGEMSRKQKDYINDMADKTSNYTYSIGTYTKNPIIRYLKDRKQKKLSAPTPEVPHENELLKRLEGYKMAPDPDKNKTPEQIKQENAKAEALRQARTENGGDGR